MEVKMTESVMGKSHTLNTTNIEVVLVDVFKELLLEDGFCIYRFYVYRERNG